MKQSTLKLVGRTMVGLGVCGAVGVACKVTKSGWPLLGLVFLPAVTGVEELVEAPESMDVTEVAEDLV